MRILLVCTGNICRSPLAAAIAQRILAERGRSDITVESAGTAAYDGSPASEGAYLVGLEHSLDLSAHRARALTRDLADRADLILGMAGHHIEQALALGGASKAHLLGEYAGRGADDAQVEDPFGGDLDVYRSTYAQLEALLRDALARVVRSETGNAGSRDQ